MDQLLNEAAVRVLGALIEKQVTTPDQYPLSANALMAACNQSSNRNPVVAYDEETVLAAVQRLRHMSLARAIQHSVSRVIKYEHLATDTMDLDARELAVLCVLMLRGPNTIGEIRTRTERLAAFVTSLDVETTINALIERQPSPLVVRLPRQAGQKEVRYAHLLSGEVMPAAAEAPAVASVVVSAPSSDRISTLEQTMREMQGEIADLRAQLAEFRKQFE